MQSEQREIALSILSQPTLLFETTRLHVRQLDGGDVDALQDVYGDADAMCWVGDGEPLAREGCVRWVDVTHRNYATRGYGMSVLVEKESDSVIGFCGLVHPGGQPEVEIKYALRRSHWGKGFATEAVKSMLAYGASRFGMREIIATTAPENLASHRVLLKAGLVPAGLRRNDDGSFTQLFAWHAKVAENDGALSAGKT